MEIRVALLLTMELHVARRLTVELYWNVCEKMLMIVFNCGMVLTLT
jgi:hypothetical protein